MNGTSKQNATIQIEVRRSDIAIATEIATLEQQRDKLQAELDATLDLIHARHNEAGYNNGRRPTSRWSRIMNLVAGIKREVAR